MTKTILLAALAAIQAADSPAEGTGSASPTTRPLKVISQPDWSDYNIYPAAARELDQEGKVVGRTTVDKEGRPSSCRITRSSGYRELDEGTCALLMQMRYEPARNAGGEAIETAIAVPISWLLNDPSAFAYSVLTVDLAISAGRITGCTSKEFNKVPRQWPRLVCSVLAEASPYYFGSSLERAKAARVILSIHTRMEEAERQAAVLGRWPLKLVAHRQVRFRVNGQGEPDRCRTMVDRGFGTPRLDHRVPCSFFLQGAWFAQPRKEESGEGLFSLKVLIAPK